MEGSPVTQYYVYLSLIDLAHVCNLCAICTFLSESLTEFVTSVRKAILPRAQSALSDELVANQPGYFIDHQMSPKKSHEVRLMAALVAAIAKDQGIQQVHTSLLPSVGWISLETSSPICTSKYVPL